MATTYLRYKNGALCMGTNSLQGFTRNYDGPLYVYDLGLMRERARLFLSSFKDISIYYAIKANNHPKILQTFNSMGLGCDVVSAGEAKKAIACGVQPDQIIFSGVGKTVEEIDFALKRKLHQINVESLSEMIRIGERAKILKKKATVVFRLNPDVSVKTHPYIATGFRNNKFGMDDSSLREICAILKRFPKNLNLKGISLHIGSQLLDVGSFDEALRRAVPVYKQLQQEGFALDRFDVGGGLGIDYKTQNLANEAKMIREYSRIVERQLLPLGCRIQAEPGRWLVGHAGVLICQIQYKKVMPAKDFLVVDSGMHHLLRPALYKSYHRIMPLKKKTGSLGTYDVVGPICESSDSFACDRELPHCQEGEFLVIADTGAYGFSMSSNYNLRAPIKECFI